MHKSAEQRRNPGLLYRKNRVLQPNQSRSLVLQNEGCSTGRSSGFSGFTAGSISAAAAEHKAGSEQTDDENQTGNKASFIKHGRGLLLSKYGR